MKIRSLRFFRSSKQGKNVTQSRATKLGNVSRSVMWFIGIVGLVLLWTISSSNPKTVPHLVSINPTSQDAGWLSGQIDILSKHFVTKTPIVGNLVGDLPSNYPNYPIIISDDGICGEGSIQCTPLNDYTKNFVRSVFNYSNNNVKCSYEHLDSCAINPNDDVYESITEQEEKGKAVGNITTFPGTSQAWLSLLSPYGAQNKITYPGYLSRNYNTLLWNDCNGSKEIRLVGFSDFGAVTTFAGNYNWEEYLWVLAANNINFTRIFAVDQWSNNYCAMNPFSASGGYCPSDPNCPRNSDAPCYPDRFDISSMNSDYFTKLTNFVTSAAKKGIIVQITLFDYCGIKGNMWHNSPYNFSNNMNDPYFGGYADIISVDSGYYLHKIFIAKVLDAVKDCGNVILEIFNEPDYESNIFMFHSKVAEEIWLGTKATILKVMNPVTNFRAVATKPRTIQLSWTNPVNDCQFAYPFTSTMIRYSTSGYPADPSVGTLLIIKSNTPGSSDSYIHSESKLPAPVTYFYSAFATNNGTHTSTKATAKATTFR